VTQEITWYDVLGANAGASAVTLRRAYDERVLLLRAYFTAPALTPPASARPARVAAAQAPAGLADAPDPVAGAVVRAADLVEEAWQVLRDPQQRGRYDAWLGPQGPARSRRLTVPDQRGLFYRSSQAVAARATLRLAVVRLTADPLPVEGLVVGQSPEPEATVRRRSTLTVQIWHPARDR